MKISLSICIKRKNKNTVKSRSLILAAISISMLNWTATRVAAQVEIGDRLTPHISIVGSPGQIAVESAAALNAPTKWTAVTNYLWAFGGRLAFYDTDLPRIGQKYYRL
jgi:hypothetical protein